MADRTITERLQPALLDRLTDHEPDQATEPREVRVIDVNRLRDIIRRDLSWLLNTHNLDSVLDPERAPRAVASVLNYGVNEVSGEFSTKVRAERIRASIVAAIHRFEPRLDADTLEVRIREREQGRHAFVTFDIVVDMWAQPYPLELYLRSEIDTTTGELTLEEAR